MGYDNEGPYGYYQSAASSVGEKFDRLLNLIRRWVGSWSDLTDRQFRQSEIPRQEPSKSYKFREFSRTGISDL